MLVSHKISDKTLIEIAKRHGYQHMNTIGSGGYGVCAFVRKAFNDMYVMKIEHKISKSVGGGNEKFALSHLDHPNIIKLCDSFSDLAGNGIVVEYCPGGTLLDMVKKKGPLPPSQILFVTKQIVDGLKYCHSCKLAHRDIKPSNILFDKIGRPILCDFGLAKFYKSAQYDDHIVGSKAFMAPELLSNNIYSPFAADIWALGVTMYYMIYGKLPWNCEEFELVNVIYSPIEYPPTENKDLVCLIKGMLQIVPSKRLTIDMVATALIKFEPPKHQPSIFCRNFTPPTLLPRGQPKIGLANISTTRSQFMMSQTRSLKKIHPQ